MARGYFENVAFRLPSQAIIISVAPYEARAAGLCEGYAEFYPWNRTHHSFIEIFNGLYETSVPEYGAGALVFFDRYAFKFQFHTIALPLAISRPPNCTADQIRSQHQFLRQPNLSGFRPRRRLSALSPIGRPPQHG